MAVSTCGVGKSTVRLRHPVLEQHCRLTCEFLDDTPFMQNVTWYGLKLIAIDDLKLNCTKILQRIMCAADFGRLCYCIWCGSLLRVHDSLCFHDCLNYSYSQQLHDSIQREVQICPFLSCSYSSSSLMDHVRHVLSFHHMIPLYVCQVCGAAFITYSSRFYHEVTHWCMNVMSSSANWNIKFELI